MSQRATRHPVEVRRNPHSMGAHRAIVESKQGEINDLVHRHHGRAVALFGSVARADDTPESDIDFLGVPVDVVSVGGLKERDDRIGREAVPV